MKVVPALAAWTVATASAPQQLQSLARASQHWTADEVGPRLWPFNALSVFFPTPCPAAVRQDELAEPAQFCDLLVTSALDAAGDPQRRRERFPALSPGRLAAALSRYRELDSQSMLMGRHHPRMPQVRDVFCVHHFPCGHTTAPGPRHVRSFLFGVTVQ